MNRRTLLLAAGPLLVATPAAALCLAVPPDHDPALRLAQEWLEAKAMIDGRPDLSDAEVDRLCDVTEAAEDLLLVTPTTSPAGALACLEMIEVSARREESGGTAGFSAGQIAALMAGARTLLAAQ
ncbi:hypothetical protein [Ancylobacter sp.]|uniref:hypothetical protein n=1 Tax=Ancylobacter sp. TaxID=1872567 RepID=UPI003C7D2B34